MRREGYVSWKYCPRCGELCLVYDDGLKLRLSRRSIPAHDAGVLAKYYLMVINIWIMAGTGNLLGTPWYWAKKPERGWLFTLHQCTLWR